MFLLLNIGNYTMTAGFYTGPDKRRVSSVSIDKNMTVDDFSILLKNIAGLYDVRPPFERALISSVVPTLTPTAVAAIEKLCGITPVVVGPGIKTGIDIKINDPSELGSDLVCMSAGLAMRYELPALLISIDDFTTISYIDERRRYLGTIIHPGLHHMMRLAVQGADLLQPAPLTPPARLLGADSQQSVRAGVLYGLCGAIDGLVERVRAEYPVRSIIATGSVCDAVLPHLKTSAQADEHLLTDGMYHILTHQKK